MSERTMNVALPDMSVLAAVKGDGENRRSAAAKVFEFPVRAAQQRGVKIDGKQFAPPAVIIEIAAAVLAFAFWLVWRLTHPTSAR